MRWIYITFLFCLAEVLIAQNPWPDARLLAIFLRSFHRQRDEFCPMCMKRCVIPGYSEPGESTDATALGYELVDQNPLL